MLLSTALTAACGGSSLLVREKPARVRDSFCQQAERATITAGTSRTVKLRSSRTSKADRSVPTKRWSASAVASAAHRTSKSDPLPSTPHVFLALEGQLDGGLAAIAPERFAVQLDKRGSATA